MKSLLFDIAKDVRVRGGRALLVGGYVRDRLLGVESKDLDVEVFGLRLETLSEVLASYGPIIEVGRAFGVLRVKGLDIDFSLPRKDSKVGAGHRGFDVATDPQMNFETAARRRDITINSMGFDPLTEEYLDPHGGRADLKRGVLRATDPAHYAEDPLRGLRVAQFSARFEMSPDPNLIELSHGLPLNEVAPERVFEELRKLLLKGKRPSLGLEFLRQSTLVRFFPELESLIGVQQDPVWHPEGDVWTHTLMVIDEASKLRANTPDDLALMLGALCHDLGKPDVTEIVDDRVRSPGHDSHGTVATESFLTRLRAPNALSDQVKALVRHHLAPALFVQNNAGAKGYRRLARKLDAAGVNMTLLYAVARADHLGRTTDEALARQFPAGETFLERAKRFLVDRQGPKDVVQGRHLIARDIEPGPQFRDILDRCRELQDEHGWDDPEQLLDAVLNVAKGNKSKSAFD